MRNRTTVEIIPINRFPLQGSILGDIVSISDDDISISIPNLLMGFFSVRDHILIFIRSHVGKNFESDCDVNIMSITRNSEDGTTTINAAFINGTHPMPEIIDEVQSSSNEDKIRYFFKQF